MERRVSDGQPHPKAVERAEQKRIKALKARGRLIGSWSFGALVLWNLLPQNQGEGTWMWLAVAVIVFGVASVDQVMKAIGKG